MSTSLFEHSCVLALDRVVEPLGRLPALSSRRAEPDVRRFKSLIHFLDRQQRRGPRAVET